MATTAEQIQALQDAIAAQGKVLAGIEEQLTALVGSINAKLKWDNPLVGDGVPRPKAPTAAEVAMDPSAYFGTPFDPIPAGQYFAISTIKGFESDGAEDNPNRFVGGTIGEWYRRDPDAAMRYLASTLQGNQINLESLHPVQRKTLFG